MKGELTLLSILVTQLRVKPTVPTAAAAAAAAAAATPCPPATSSNSLKNTQVICIGLKVEA